jgi:hypothetical protein
MVKGFGSIVCSVMNAVRLAGRWHEKKNREFGHAH